MKRYSLPNVHNSTFTIASVDPLLDWNLVVRVNNERVKEGKRLIFPGLRTSLSRSRESARNREREGGREGEKEREREGREEGRERERKKERNTRGPSSNGAKVLYSIL